MKIARFNYGMLDVDVSLDQERGIAHVKYLGVLTLDGLHRSNKDVAGAVQNSALGFVSRLDQAAVAMTEQDWFNCHDHHAPTTRPGSVIVAPRDAANAMAYTKRLRDSGVPRQAFIGQLQHAVSWVEDQISADLEQLAWRLSQWPP